MNERMMRWVAGGVLAAGFSAAMLLGATIAAAEPASGADGATSSSQSDASDSGPDTGSKDSDGDESEDGPANAAEKNAAEKEDASADDDVDVKPPDDAAEVAQPEVPSETDEQVSSEEDVTTGSPADTADGSARDDTGDSAPVGDTTGSRTVDTDDVVTPPPAEDPDKHEPPVVDGPAADVVTEPVPGVAEPVVIEPEGAAPVETEPSTANVVMSAVEVDEPAPAQPTLLNIIGSLFFGIFDMVAALFDGPPAVPPGSTVRVGRSTLEIDCGDGYQASTDWYFPTEAEPDKIIYFQHGAFARAALYNYTAAELAERNNAIVVAPSITSNYFACDGCQMAGEQMHAAIANLFLGDRAALLASAQAAGYTGTALPQRFVIAGHSGGGQTAGGAAGYYAEFARLTRPERLHDMAGVLLLDTSPIGGAIERGVAKIPLDIPVHVISAEPGPLNDYGGANEVLARVRPDFVGVQIIGGAHGDAWQSSNAFAQFFVGLGTGFSQPRNIEAVHTLAQGWIADWFDDPDALPVYGERGEVITVDTDAGRARAYVIPGPAPRLTIIDEIIRALLRSTAGLSQFSGACAADPSAPTTTPDSGKTPHRTAC